MIHCLRVKCSPDQNVGHNGWLLNHKAVNIYRPWPVCRHPAVESMQELQDQEHVKPMKRWPYFFWSTVISFPFPRCQQIYNRWHHVRLPTASWWGRWPQRHFPLFTSPALCLPLVRVGSAQRVGMPRQSSAGEGEEGKRREGDFLFSTPSPLDEIMDDGFSEQEARLVAAKTRPWLPFCCLIHANTHLS